MCHIPFNSELRESRRERRLLKDLIEKLLANAEGRLSAVEALKHPWFSFKKHRKPDLERCYRIAEYLDFEVEPTKTVITFP